MSGYYFLRVKKDYASAIIEDLQKLDAVELINADDTGIPEWQKNEVFARLREMEEHPENVVDWDTALKKIRQRSK